MIKSIDKQVLQQITKYCAKSEKCVSDVLKKLEPLDIDEKQKLAIIDYLKKEKFIDEKRYALAYTNEKIKLNKWGKRKIYWTLREKNISSTDIDYALKSVNNVEYFEILKSELKKKQSLFKNLPNNIIKRKLYAFGQQRGFEFELVQRAVDEILK